MPTVLEILWSGLAALGVMVFVAGLYLLPATLVEKFGKKQTVGLIGIWVAITVVIILLMVFVA